MKRDFGLMVAGTQVALVASGDEKHPPENIIDGNTETFWITTGMFPQEFILSFANLIKISSMKIHCYNVRSLSIEKSVARDPVDFEPLTNSAGRNQCHTPTICHKIWFRSLCVSTQGYSGRYRGRDLSLHSTTGAKQDLQI
ncbi:intraflagellar transport protein 25 homolog isoform X2 [Carcharodon carcharias]|uniref:intraflagellar transport protein 25 homolog isoform X2 n=1 Tax=Carcharodon carcharias TaxID=13397 RepID=UPI001B7F12A2|nr:intraflagellar transport protein 25 homolog isoform X2 [Carcharodon carcharias]